MEEGESPLNASNASDADQPGYSTTLHSYRPSLRYSVCLQPGAEEEKEWKGNVSLIVEEEEKNDQQENNEDNGPGHDDGASQDNIHVLDESVLIDDSERMNDSPSPIVDASPSIVSSPLAPSVLPIPRTTPLLQHNINSLNESIPNDENVPPSNHTTPAASGSARASLLLSPIPIARASKSPDRIPLSDIQNVVNDDFENDKNDSIYKSPSSRLSYSRISSASIQPSIERDVCEQHTSVTVGTSTLSCVRCRCRLSRNETKQYNDLLATVSTADSSAMDAFEAYLSALKICDDDVALHIKIVQMASEMGIQE